uniref:Uncharacterized protein n=1 Tax=uncultured prokaryote TaxID=198431 RepID=A0A0H5Q3B8_9ZZZZ|nr:hypothetical protein [uncultured prokaryote]
MTKSICFGIPTAWYTYSTWVEWLLQWLSSQTTYEVTTKWANSNTKCVAYSALIDAAREAHSDYLVILETNHVVQMPLQDFLERIQHFNCVISPPRYPGAGGQDVFRTLPMFFDCKTPETMPPKDQPFEIKTASTGVVALKDDVIEMLKPLFYFNLHDGLGGAARIVPIYCYDGDDMDEERVDLAYSLFNNIRRCGFGAWADPGILTANLRLSGYESYR